MKCIVCDRKEAVDHGLCPDCLAKNIQITVNGSVDVTVCPKCNSFKIGNRWYRTGMNEHLAKKISDHVSVKDKSTDVHVLADSVELKRLDGRIEFTVTTGSEETVSHPRLLSIPSKILLNSCPTCNKMTGSYYEAIIQLRTLGMEYTSVIDDAMDQIDPFLVNMESNANDSFLSKVVRLKEGLDLYLGKKNDALKISKFLHDNFFSEVKTTKKLAGRKEGEDFYRYTFLVRLLNLKPGTMIYHANKTYVLESISPNSLTIVDVDSEKRQSVQQNEFYSGSYSYSSETVPMRKFLVVSNGQGESQIMDSENFEIFTIRGKFSGEIHAFDVNGKLIAISSSGPT